MSASAAAAPDAGIGNGGGGGGGEAAAFDELLLALHEGPGSADPWAPFLHRLCAALDGCSATLVLRHPASGDRGELFDVNTVAAIVDRYRSRVFDDDPFAGLGEGVAAAIPDRVDPAALHDTRYYRDLMAPDRILDMLAINIGFATRYVGSLRVARRADAGARPFGLLEKSLLVRLHPHLRCALAAHERERRHRIENHAYLRAIDQLAVGVIVLNDRGDLVQVNESARRMIDGGLLAIADGQLQAVRRTDGEALARMIAAGLADRDLEAAAPRWLQIAGEAGGAALHLLLKPIRDGQPHDDARPLGLALYLTGADRSAHVTSDACAALFGLTRAEALLLAELIGGASILSASLTLGISESTARTQLRSMFGKTGTHRQADLLRLVLTSLATIA